MRTRLIQITEISEKDSFYTTDPEKDITGYVFELSKDMEAKIKSYVTGFYAIPYVYTVTQGILPGDSVCFYAVKFRYLYF